MHNYKWLKYKLALLVLMGTLSSCLVTKKYKAPELTEANYLFRLDSLAAQKTDMPVQSWKEFFKDPVLIGYIDTALVYNKDNQIAFHNLAKFQAKFKQDRAAYLPAVDLNASAQRQKQAENSQFGSFFSEPFVQYDLSGTLSWEADIWGKINSQKLASKAQFAQSLTAQQALQNRLIASIADHYYRLLEADRRKLLLEQTLVLREQSVFTQQALKESGQANSLAVSQAEGQLFQAKLLLTEVEDQIFTLENNLSLLIGKPLAVVKRSRLDVQEDPEFVALSLPLELLANRPDVKEAELEYRSFFEAHNVAKASLYPNISLSANGGYQSLDAETWIRPTSLFNTLTAGITQPLFNRRRLRTQKITAQANMEQSLLRFQQKVLEASVELSNVLKSYEKSAEKKAILKEQENILQTSFSDAQALQDAGMANYMDVLNAQERLLNTQLQLIQTDAQHLQNAVTLYRALGGGVKQ